MSWSDLPEDLLLLISHRLADSRLDIKRFRAVCPSWRFYVPPPPSSPFPVFTTQTSETTHVNFKLFQNIVYHLQDLTTGRSRLVQVREKEEDGNVELKDAFGRSLEEDDLFPASKVINLLNFRVSRLAKFYDLYQLKSDLRLKLNVGPLITPLSLLHPASSALNDNDPMLVFAWFKTRYGNLVRHRAAVIYNGILSASVQSDIVQHNGKLFEFCRPTGEYVTVSNYSLLPSARINIPGFVPFSSNKYCLVSFEGDLFLVNKSSSLAIEYDNWQEKPVPENGNVTYDNDDDAFQYFSSNKYIEVYKLDEEQQQWVEVTNLGDAALCLCQDYNFGVSVGDFAGIEKGYVYFLCADPLDTEAKVVWGYNLEEDMLCLDRHACFNLN